MCVWIWLVKVVGDCCCTHISTLLASEASGYHCSGAYWYVLGLSEATQPAQSRKPRCHEMLWHRACTYAKAFACAAVVYGMRVIRWATQSMASSQRVARVLLLLCAMALIVAREHNKHVGLLLIDKLRNEQLACGRSCAQRAHARQGAVRMCARVWVRWILLDVEGPTRLPQRHRQGMHCA